MGKFALPELTPSETMTRTIAPLAALLAAVSLATAQTPELAAEGPVEAAVETAADAAATAVEAVEEAVEETADEVVETAEEPTLVEPAVGEAPSVDTVIAASPVIVSPAAAGPVCCPIRIVSSHTTLSAKRALRCSGPPVQTMACVDNPADCTCTHYQIPLCVPCCCVGEPRVCNARAGLLGRGRVDLVWPCGFTAKVVFLKHGGAKIIYVAG